MRLRLFTLATVATGFFVASQAQTISFNTPIPWVSQRSDTITVRAQVDTAALKGKEIAMQLLLAEKGKTTSLSSKKFKLTDPSGEFTFGKINKSLVGGESFLKISWNIPGTEEKGVIEPVGIADLTAQTAKDTIKAVKVGDNTAAAEIASKAVMSQLGAVTFGLAWNKNKLFIVTKKISSGDTLQIALDGKCGKNAFLSFPDRFIFAALSDTVKTGGFHFQREAKDNNLLYTKKEWQNEISFETSADNVVISMPWYDSGIIPFEERAISAGVFVISADGKTAVSVPQTAKRSIPATWGTILLQK